VSSPLGRNSSIGHLVPSCSFPSNTLTVCRWSLCGRGSLRALRATSGYVRGIETTRGLVGAKCLCATVHKHRAMCSWSVFSVLGVSDTAGWVTAVSSSSCSMLSFVSATVICKEKCIGISKPHIHLTSKNNIDLFINLIKLSIGTWSLQFGRMFGEKFSSHIQSSTCTVPVEMFLSSVVKCVQLCTASHQADDNRHSEWQQRHKCQRFCNLPNLSFSLLRISSISV